VLIKNGLVVTMDSKKRVIKNGGLIFDEDKIIDVGKTRELEKSYSGEVYDAQGKMILPGFVNTHNHMYQTIMRGLRDDGEGKRQEKYRWDIELLRGLDRSSCYASGRLAIVEMIRSGITTTQDSHYINFHLDSIDGIAKSARDSGFRLILGRGSWDLQGLAPEELTEDVETAIRESRRVTDKWHNDDMTKVNYEASLLSQVSDELIIETKKAASDNGLGWAIHIQEPLGFHKKDPRSKDTSLKQYGGRAIEYLNSLNILGEDSLLIHCTFTTNREIPILAQTQTPIAHCPCANAWAGRSIVTPVPSMIEAGVTVGLGTDGALTNNSLDMLHTMNFAALINKVNYGSSKVMTAERVLEMSTIWAARALSIEEKVGSIEVGKKADLVLIDLKTPGMVPALLPIKNLVYSTSSKCIDTVIINGKKVMENKILLTIDEEEVIKEAEKQAWKLLDSSGHFENDLDFLKRGNLSYEE
jgi:5-methylthioadenosine/S-adenosylhomocysteine deaminase